VPSIEEGAMKPATGVLVGAIIGGVAVYYGLPIYEMRGAMKGPQCKALVKLSLAGNQIQVVPENTCLHKGRTLTWEVTAGANDKVEIDFKSPTPQGPFPTGNPHNPRPGHYEKMGAGEIETRPAGQKGRFDYKITWTPSGGPPITLDPAICIRGG
jgi:hypothetical protein